MNTFDNLRAMKVGPVTPMRVRAIKDLHWSIQEPQKESLHCSAGEAGWLVSRSPMGFIVKFDSGKIRQIFDMRGTGRKAEDEIELISSDDC